MGRPSLTSLLVLASSKHCQMCFAFSPPTVSPTYPSIVLCREKTTSNDATAPSQESDSSYEALRRKFGLADSPNRLEGQSEIDLGEPMRIEYEQSQSQTIDSTPEPTEFVDDFVEELEESSVELSLDSFPLEDMEQSVPEPPLLETTYSRKFARYSIPLTTFERITKDDLKKEVEDRRQRRLKCGVINKLKPTLDTYEKGLFDGLFNMRKSLVAKTKNLDPQIENAYAGRPIRWITSDSYRANENNRRELVDEDFVAAAAFWRMAADLSQQKGHRIQPSYLALPQSSLTVAQHLCDIINWYAEFLVNDNKDGTKRGGDATIILHAKLDTTHSNSVPVVEFTADYYDEKSQQPSNTLSASEESKPTKDDTEKRTKSWVQRLLVQLGVCPFTKSNIKSGQGLGDVGVPVANIMYRHSTASYIDHGISGEMYILMADTWEAISDMVAAGSSGKHGVSSILLSAPSFDDNFSLWAGPVFAMLEAGVSAIQAEEIIGVVCFHPEYATPDGSTFPGFGHMHSLPRLKKWYNQFTTSTPLSDNEIAAGGAWQRRTPHSVINVLRAEQLEAAEGRRDSGILYEQNIRVLVGRDDGIGTKKLEEDLKREQSL